MGKHGEETFYLVTLEVSKKSCQCPYTWFVYCVYIYSIYRHTATNTKYTPYEEFILLKKQAEIPQKVIIGSHGNNSNKQAEKDTKLKDELLFLKKENEPLRNEIIRKDQLINIFTISIKWMLSS